MILPKTNSYLLQCRKRDRCSFAAESLTCKPIDSYKYNNREVRYYKWSERDPRRRMGVEAADTELRFNRAAIRGWCPSQTIHAGPKSVSSFGHKFLTVHLVFQNNMQKPAFPGRLHYSQGQQCYQRKSKKKWPGIVAKSRSWEYLKAEVHSSL